MSLGKNVLVTGGAGYVGSHICKALSRAGLFPVTFDNLTRGHAWAVRWGPLECYDLNDSAALRGVIGKYSIDAVIHCAALAYVDESIRSPEFYFQNNVVGSLTLLDAVLESRVRHLILSSTCAVYGVPDRVPIGEETVPFTINPYGETKLAVERALQWYGAAHDLRWMALRYFNAAGADFDGEIGPWHNPEVRLIPSAIRALLGQRGPLEIYGDDYPTPDGTAIRDFVHVSDLADAHVQALECLVQGVPSGIFNLGTGRGYSVREVIDQVSLAGGRRVPVHHAPRRQGDPPILIANAERAALRLGWRPRCSDLATIVDTAWRWHARSIGNGVLEWEGNRSDQDPDSCVSVT
jgi:UDP-arabinose 4-epimerase